MDGWLTAPATQNKTNNNFSFTMENDMEFRSALLLSSLALFAATPIWAMKSAAPDAGGYSYIDNHEAAGPSYNFEDISASGTPFSLSDDTTFDIALPFNFTFYSNTYASVRVSSNGFISFDNTDSGCCTGQPIPVDDDNNNLIAAWWEDLDPRCSGASQQWQVLGTAPHRRLIIQHNYTPAYGCVSGDNTFQYKLFESTNIAEVHYKSLTSGDGGTYSIGIEAPAGATGHQVYLGSGITPPYSSNWAIRYQYQPLLNAEQDGETSGLEDLNDLLSANPPAQSESSGGGALNPLLLLAMSGLFLARRRKS